MSPTATHLKLVNPDLTVRPARPDVPPSDRPREPAIPATAEAADPVGRRPLGHLLLEEGYVTPDILVQAVARLRMVGTSLADVLLANGWITEDQLLTALSAEWSAGHLDPAAFPPDPAVAARFTPDEALLIGALPWRKLGGMTIIAATRPAAFERAKARLPEAEGPFLPAFVSRATLQDAMTAVFGPALNAVAEARPALSESCRSFNPRRAMRIAVLAACTGLLLLLTMPAVLGAGLMLWATLTLVATTGLKLAALVATATMRIPDTAGASRPQRLPMITMMVPLFHEADIAARLVARLSRLTWPRELTDILLVVEAVRPEDPQRAGRFGPAVLDAHRDRARRHRAHEAPRAELCAELRQGRHRRRLGCRGCARARPADRGRAAFRRRPARCRLPAGHPRFLQCPAELAVALLCHRIRRVVPGRPAGPCAAGPCRPPGRHDAVLPPRGAGRHRRLGRA